MIEIKKYILSGKFNENYFLDKMYKMVDKKNIEILQINTKIKPESYVFHLSPGLSAVIRNGKFPVFAYGDPKNFKKGVSILEELLNNKLIEVKIYNGTSKKKKEIFQC